LPRAQTIEYERFLPEGLRTFLRSRYETGYPLWTDYFLVREWFRECKYDFNLVVTSWGGITYQMAQDCLPLLVMIGELAKEKDA
jgi:hypothetical protein